MNTIPLFPLASVLFPKGRMTLKIFEQRYLDLVASCMKTDTGFGVVWLERGSEVANSRENELRFGEIGTYARIVDWDGLPNGLLGITIEGGENFKVHDTEVEDSHLLVSSVEYWPDMAELHDASFHDHFLDVLSALIKHPQLKGLDLQYDRNNTLELAGILTQYLPVSELVKYEVLCIEEPMGRLQRVDEILCELNGAESTSDGE